MSRKTPEQKKGRLEGGLLLESLKQRLLLHRSGGGSSGGRGRIGSSLGSTGGGTSRSRSSTRGGRSRRISGRCDLGSGRSSSLGNRSRRGRGNRSGSRCGRGLFLLAASSQGHSGHQRCNNERLVHWINPRELKKRITLAGIQKIEMGADHRPVRGKASTKITQAIPWIDSDNLGFTLGQYQLNRAL